MYQKSTPTRRALEMFAIIEKYLASGLKRKEFCEQESITYSTFTWWFHQHRKSNPSSVKASPKDFIQVHRPPSQEISTQQGPTCVVEYPNGVVIRFSGEMNVHTISQLVKIQAD